MADAAREAWWIGLRDAEKEHYATRGHSFEEDQHLYREGFEAALRRDLRGKSFDDAEDSLRAGYPDICDTPAFRAGYERGRVYIKSQENVGAEVR